MIDIKDTSNWIRVQYEYFCPAGDYLDESNTQIINEEYYGPDKLFVIVNNETGKIYDTLIEVEINDGRPTPAGHTVIELDPTVYPLEVEVLSDYHNNSEDEEEQGFDSRELRQIGFDGHHKFEYTFPIHPDELYDDRRSYYDWSTKKFVLVQNTNEDIIGEFPGWEITKQRRNFSLTESDAWLMNPTLTEEQIAEIHEYKQKLRDFPKLWQESDHDDIFSDSCWPIKPSFIND
jgi:hypothetical protein